MNITEALKGQEAHLDNRRRRLLWSLNNEAWIVYGQEYGEKYARVVVITEDEEIAIQYLLYEEED